MAATSMFSVSCFHACSQSLPLDTMHRRPLLVFFRNQSRRNLERHKTEQTVRAEATAARFARKCSARDKRLLEPAVVSTATPTAGSPSRMRYTPPQKIIVSVCPTTRDTWRSYFSGYLSTLEASSTRAL